MNIVVLIVRLLLGLVFLVFGLNAFLQFHNGPIPGGVAGQFLQALFRSHYVLAIGAVQTVGGALLLINRYVPPGADDSWAGDRKHFALPSAAQSRRHRRRPDRGAVLVCVVLPLSPVFFRDLYRKGFVCAVTANACGFARSPKPFCADLRR
jgi:hypothetical protein